MSDAGPPRSYAPIERHDLIVELAAADGRVEVGDLAQRLGVTTETIRRDLALLQDRQVLRRVHGGAVPWQRWRHEPLLSVRGRHHAEEKHRIAKRALDELPAEGAIIIDSGSTAAHVAALLPHDRPLTVVTNSIPAAQVLATNDGAEVVLLGGALKKNTLALVDATTVDALAAMVVDLVYTSADGFSAARGFTTPYREEVAVKQAMMAAARRAVMLVDHSKLGSDQLYCIARIADVDTIITGTELDGDDAEALRELGPSVVQA